MNTLKDKVAVVTGGSRGIGRAIVEMLARGGCHVAFNYHSNKEKAESLTREMRALSVKCTATRADVRNYEEIKAWIDQVKKDFGRLDILVNNAGIIKDKALMMMAPEDWREVIDTNLSGVFNVTRLCVVTFLKQKSGQIINISSISGVVGLPRQTNYSATKGGINAFTKSLAKEVAAYGIRVNAVAPGYIETDMVEELNDKQRQEILERIPQGRIGKAGDVAKCVQFLLSEQAQYITGQVIHVDGGLVMHS